MSILMITALIIPIGVKASETADGSASGVSAQAAAQEEVEEQDSSASDAEKEEQAQAPEEEAVEEQQESDSFQEKESEDSSDSEQSVEKSREDQSKENAETSAENKDEADSSQEQKEDKTSVEEDASPAAKTDSAETDKAAKDSSDAAKSGEGEKGAEAASDSSAEQSTAANEEKDNTITFRTEEVTVVADKKAFDTDVTMKVKKVTDPAQLLKMVTALQSEGGSYTVKAYNVSFYDENGNEVEPKIPVQVNVNTRVSSPRKTKVVHVKDDDKTEILEADIDRSGASFELGSFSDIGVATEGKAKVPGSSFDLYLGDELTTDYTVDDLPAGPISEDSLPAVEGYSYENATVGDDQVEEIGTITDEEGNVYVYYTTKDENGTIKAEILGDGRIRINLVETDKNTTYELEADGTRVRVEAPADAFDEGTYMEIQNVRLDESQAAQVQEQAARVLGRDVEMKIQAVDISFYDKDGQKVQPRQSVKVDLTTPQAVEGNFCVVHLGETADQVEAQRSEDGRISFSADSFSIYAVVDEGSTEDEARMTLNFYNGEKLIATIYVKNSDTPEELEKIIYDPGAGDLGQNELFRGWIIDKKAYTVDDSENAKDIVQIREWAAEETISESTVHNIYAMIYKTYSVTFKDEEGVNMHSESLVFLNNEEPTYTINTPYTPKNQDAEFQGWTTQDAVEPESPLYSNGTEVTIKGNVVFRPKVPNGYWLSFNENGNGASYTPPQFIESGKVTKKPSDPTRFGYTFGGWYTNQTCTAGNEFTFGQRLTGRTTLYAKWTPVAKANYTVIIWKQNVEGNGYDFDQSLTLTGNVGSNVNSISSQGSGRSAYAIINGTNYTGHMSNEHDFTGFSLDRFDQNVTIKPEGNSVVNVYYKRNSYTFTFGSRGTFDGYTRVNNNLYQAKDPLTTVYTVTRLYGQNISDIWSFRGSDGNNYPFTGDWKTSWKPTNSSTYTARITRMETMPAEDITFRHMISDRTTRYFHYYVEALPGATNTRTFNGKQYSLYTDLTHDFQIVVYEDDFWKLDGFTREAIATANGTNVTSTIRDAGKNGIGWQGNWYSNLYFYYTRDKYPITFWDGVYVDGDNNPVDEQNRNLLHTSDEIYYQASTASYNKGGTNYYVPTYNGYAFEGWYLDDACTQPYTFTTMPKGGIKVYAKWRQIQYRVFLHPNVPTSDTSFSMGGQNTSFRVNYGEKIAGGSAIYGTRDDYDLIGWYTDEGCTNAFNFDAYVLNDTTVKTQYGKTEDTELDKYGNTTRPDYNSDSDQNRYWITKKLDLYAKWRAKLPGAKGIHVTYDANDTKNNINGTNPPKDPLLYLDSSEALAGAASTPSDTNYQFLYWVVQTWDEASSKYVDTDKVVYPGDGFEVLKANAQQVNNPEWTGVDDTEHDHYIYTVQLRAEYGPKEGPKTVHIHWYPNKVDINGNPITTTLKVDDGVKGSGKYNSPYTDQKGYFGTDQLQINEAVDIAGAGSYSYPGYTFKGWVRADSTKSVSGGPWLKYTGSGYTVNQSGTETSVTRVAADEKTPDQNMFAVWEKSAPFLNIAKTEANSSPVNYLDGAKFTLSKMDGSGNYQTVQADLQSSKSAGATGVRFTNALADGSYKLTETQAPQNHKIDIPVITFTVTGGVLKSTTPGVTFVDSIDDADNNVYTVTLENTKTAAVTVTKEVVGIEADQSTGFEFTIKGVASSDQTETLYGRESEGKKHTVTYEDIPYGTEVTVTETGNDAFDTAYTLNGGAKQNGTSKTFILNDTTVNDTTNKAEVVFTNTRKNVKLKVDKVVANGTSVDQAREFSFNWKAESGSTTIKTGTFSLTDPADPAEIEIPVGSKLTVTEETGQSWPYTTTSALGTVNGTAEFVLDSVSTDNDSQIITFTNTRQSGNATVTKIVAGNMGEKDKAFSFTASLKDGDTPLYLVKNASTITVGTQETGSTSVTFDCKHNETMNFTDLPVGAVLTITESEYGEYQQTYTIGSADAVTGRTAELTVTSNNAIVTFTNTKTAVAPTQLHSGTRPMAVLVVFGLGAMILLAAHHFKDKLRNSNNM